MIETIDFDEISLNFQKKSKKYKDEVETITSGAIQYLKTVSQHIHTCLFRMSENSSNAEGEKEDDFANEWPIKKTQKGKSKTGTGCFKCGEEGHFSKECPKRRKKSVETQRDTDAYSTSFTTINQPVVETVAENEKSPKV